ncbi:hypothetical protein PLCT1_01068 [Planctomycetaceae bacterium]|nr:hypothetical protein PLCT1_01068 [Planctomycetaceae bacterium]
MLSWAAALAVSGQFEPYDSASGLLVNQFVLSVPAVVLSWRYRPSAPLLFLFGAYVGMNLYSYGFGGSEHRVWAALGAITSLLLLVLPAALVLIVAVVRRLRRTLPPPGEDPSRFGHH